jgi:hypothetical protein
MQKATFSPLAVLKRKYEQMSCVAFVDAESLTDKALQYSLSSLVEPMVSIEAFTIAVFCCVDDLFNDITQGQAIRTQGFSL